jgi:hypothetical protein
MLLNTVQRTRYEKFSGPVTAVSTDFAYHSFHNNISTFTDFDVRFLILLSFWRSLPTHGTIPHNGLFGTSEQIKLKNYRATTACWDPNVVNPLLLLQRQNQHNRAVVAHPHRVFMQNICVIHANGIRPGWVSYCRVWAIDI